jgi:antagonist of KipI
VMGSRATYLRGGFGGFLGRALQAGDILLHGAAPDASLLIARAGKDLRPPDFYTRTAGETAILEVIPGVQAEMFTARGLETFYTSEYTVSALSDRMGYRLEGEAIEHRAAADILSEGVVFGAVQVPANGKPLVLMADRQTAGGYAKIAAVVTADLPALAQQPLGTGRVRFRETTVEQAQARLKEMAGIAGC